MTEKKAAELFRRIAAEIIMHPELLRVQVINQDGELELNVKAHRGDTGKLLGSRGKLWNSLQIIFFTIGQQQKQRIVLNPLIEPTEGRAEKYPEFRPREAWDRERIGDLLTDIVQLIWPRAEVFMVDDMALTEIGVITGNTELAERIVDALKPIVEQVGRRQGRTMTVKLEEPQPATAAGRYAKEGR